MNEAGKSDRTMPRNVEAEAALLGALMIDNRVGENVGDLREEHFYEPLHGRIFAAIQALRSKGQDAKPITLRPMFENDPAIQQLGGVGYLGALTGSGAALIGAASFAKQIRDLARLRCLAEMGQAVAASAMDTATDVDPLARITEAEAMLAEIAADAIPAGAAVSFASAIAMAAAEAQAMANGERTMGVTVDGLPEWNEVVGGGAPAGDLIYLAGRPSMGKTALALRVARGAARAGFGVLFISREMKVLPIGTRLLADLMFEAGSPATMEDIRTGKLSATDFRLMAEIEAGAASEPLVFEEPQTLNVAQVAPMIRQHKRAMAKKGITLGMVVIDYVGLIDPPKTRGNREQEISDISRALKSAALTNAVVILALSQLSRAVEQREDKRPVLSDLRDSGSLEQDADAVIFAYRAQYYLERSEPPVGSKNRDQWEVEMQAERNRLEIRGAKLRQGAIQSRKCWYFGSRQAIRSDDYFRTGGGVAGAW